MNSDPPTIRILCTGNWAASQVRVNRSANSRELIPEVESAIESAWQTALARPGIHLFDGPMCRLESFAFIDEHLDLTLSQSSYKVFLGTNMAHPEFAEQFGPQVMANPVGVSPALLTRDGQILLGRRTGNVAYYPNRVHPFAGSMEPTDANPFAAIRRELQEELLIEAGDIGDIRCIGIVEDRNLRQPEMIFTVTTIRSRGEIEKSLDPVEHQAIWGIPANADAVDNAAANDLQLTPVAVAALKLWARIESGQARQ